MQETAMFPVIKKQLNALEFSVKAEVNSVDIMAKKGNKTLLVEMKTSFSISLIYQGSERQKLSDYVYLAIPKPAEKTLRSKTFKEKQTITKRLGLGLMLVDVDNDHVTFLVDPALPTPRKDAKKRRKLEKEFLLRQTAINEGGVTRTKIITSYRELALRIAYFLKDGEKPLKDIVDYTGEMKTTRVLQNNHYAWFVRVSRGIYALSEDGKKALQDYADVIDRLA